MDDAALLDAVLLASRHAFVPMPDTRVIERAGWFQLITPSLPDGGLNEVALAVLAPHEVDTVAQQTIAEYRALGVRFRWTVGPDSAPDDLVTRLEAHGLEPEVVWAVARVIDPLQRSPSLRAGIELEPVDERNVVAFTEVMARGWGMSPAPMLAFNRKVLDSARERLPMVLARWHGEPAAAAGLVLSPGTAFFLGAVVLPEHRGRGLYRALVDSRLHEAAQRGCTLSAALAREATSHPILARLGFRDVGRLTMLTPPRP